MFGVTLYGIIDIGLQYDSHGAPFNDYFPAGSADIVQKDSNHSVVGATPSNLSQSRVGLSGLEPLGVGDWNGIFKLETYFNPQSGEISDALKSLAQNNGRAAVDRPDDEPGLEHRGPGLRAVARGLWLADLSVRSLSAVRTPCSPTGSPSTTRSAPPKPSRSSACRAPPPAVATRRTDVWISR